MAATAVAAAAGLSGGETATATGTGDRARAELRTSDGREVGTFTLTQYGEVVQVDVHVSERGGLPGGFHGFHVHAVGRCDAPAFTTAGPHYDDEGRPHAEHAGDFPNLFVKAAGTARQIHNTDRFTVAEVRNRAVIVHANADNHANIPSRYGGPDAETREAGDSGGRIACGVIE